jgi:hypothetical protein
LKRVKSIYLLGPSKCTIQCRMLWQVFTGSPWRIEDY